jgi:subtilase family serine protease/flagellar hook assembly protein FlgD
MQRNGKSRKTVAMLGVAVGMLLAAALISWGQLGRTSQSPSTRLQPQGRGPSRQQLQNLEIVAHVKPDAFRPAAVRGRYVYILGRLLAIYDIADPQNIRKVGELTVSGQVISEQLALVGNYAYVVALEEFSGGGYDIKLRIVDVSDPTRPREVGQYAPTGKKVYAVIVGNNYAYVGVSGSGSSALHVLNISNPANPQFVREITNVDDLEGDGGTVAGNRLYLVHGIKGISIWDISQPDNPQRLGSLDTPGVARSVAVSGNYAFVSEGRWFDPGAEKGYLRVVDVSNPANPQIVASVDVGDNNPWFPLALDSANNRLFVGLSDRSRTVVYNISNPTNPIEVWRGEGLFGGADFSARRLVTSSGIFIVWDISGATPNRLGEHGLPHQPVVAALKDNYIVTNSKNGLVVFNVANPSQPQLVKHLPLEGFQMSSGRLVFAGDVGIYSHGVGNTNNLFFLNFADPTSPQLLQSYSHNYGIFALAVIGDYLYVGRGGGRDIYSISSRARLSSQTGNTILAMAAKVDPNIAGSVLYEAYQTGLTSALRILPINDPPIPSSPLGELRFNEWIDDMAIVGDTVFLVTRKGDLYIVDASDPTNPQQVGSWTNPVRDQTYRARILVSGNFAYLSLYSQGLVVLDLSSLSVVASMKGVYVNEVAVSGNLIYAAGDYGGLYVLRNLALPQVLPPVIYSVAPNTVPTSSVTLRISGANFQPNAQVWLERSSQRLNSTRVSVVGDSIIYADFNLASASLGKWDIVVRNPDGNIARRTEALTVATAPDLTVASLSIEPSTNLQVGTSVTLKATVRNSGELPAANFIVRFFANDRQIGEQPITRLNGNSQAEVTLPWRVLGGNYQIRAVVDADNTVAESNEGNNEASLPINLPAPDFAVTSLNISPNQNLKDGTRVQVQATVTNQGGGTVFPVTVTLLVDEGKFGEQVISEGLGANQNKTLSFSLTLSSGFRKISVVVDPANELPESDENNNRRDLTLPDIPMPDIAITDLRTYPSTNLSPGMSIQLIATLHNFGGATERGFVLHFSAANFSQQVWIYGMEANEDKEVEVTWWNIPPGQHRLVATVDPQNVVPETNKANNQATSTVDVSAPDLIAESVEINPASFVSGTTVTVAVTVNISGAGRTLFAIPVRLLDNDVPVSEGQIDPGIPAGRRVVVRIPYQARPGERRLKVVVDPDNRVPEPNENNNTQERTVTVPVPDVAILAELLPNNPGTGSPFYVRGVVRNDGATTIVPFRVVAEVLDESDRVIATNYLRFSAGMAGSASENLNIAFTRFFEMKKVRVKVVWEISNFQDGNPANDEVLLQLADVNPPDYAVAGLDVQLQEPVGMGRNITFRITVTNRGGSYRLPPSVSGIPIRIFVNDQPVTTAAVGGLDTNVTTTAVANWRIDRPLSNPTVRVVLDPDHQFPDADRTNNETQTQLSFSVQKLDLRPVDVEIVPANRPVGEWVNIQVRVRKEGTGDYFGPVPVRVIVDDVPLWKNSPYLALTDSSPEGIVQFGWQVTPGNERKVQVIVDPDKEVDEQDETNNLLEKTINYPAEAPDFVVESIDYSPKENVRQGDTVTFTVTVKNKGAAVAVSVPVLLLMNTGFWRYERVSLGANESKTVQFQWQAAPGGDHQVTVEVDPKNSIPESDEANNRLVQLLPLQVAPRPIVELRLSYPPSPVSPGSQFTLNWLLINWGAESVPVTLSVSGLPEGWAQIEPVSGILPANGFLNGQVTVTVPNNWAESRDFTVTLQAQANSTTLRQERKFKVDVVPQISDLSPYDGTRTGSTTVEFTWRTQIPSSSEVYIKRPIDPEWQRYTGESGTFHRVVVSGLRRNSTYLFYVRSAASGGESKSGERRIFVTQAVSFMQPEYSMEARRDYDQRLTVYVINNDRKAHLIKAELVDNPYEDVPAGLLGEGTFDEPARLAPGQSLPITFAAHFQDARQNDYTFRIRVRTLDEQPEQSDEALVKIRVRPPDVRIRIVQIGEDPLSMTKTFRVINEGTDPATDLTIDPSGLSAEQVGMQPLIQHAYLAPKQSIEFKIFPMLLPPGFRPFGLSDIVDAKVSFENSPGFGLGNRYPWEFPPYDLFILLNGVEIGSFQNTILFGEFILPVPPKVLLPVEVTRSADLRMQPEEVRPIPSSTVQPIVQKLQSGVTLKVSYANRTEQMTVQFFDKPSRQGADRFFIVNKGTRVISQQVEATHCTNQPVITVPFRIPFLNAELRLDKRNINVAHFFSTSKFKLDICVSNFKVVVKAGSEEEARTVAERLCNTLTKQPSKPNTVIVTLIGDGPPYKRGKPITVRARVMGEGDPTTATVQATFSNGDPPIFLRHTDGNFFEGRWIPTKIPSNARVESDGSVSFNVTVTVTATGCEQSATGTADAQIRLSAIKFKFTRITDLGESAIEAVNTIDNYLLLWKWSPGTEKVIHFSGVVVDEEGQPVPAVVSVLFKFFPAGTILEDFSSIPEKQQEDAASGSFTFGYPKSRFVKLIPGRLEAFFEARFKEADQLRVKKTIVGIIEGEYQLQVNKDGYLFWRAKVRGRTEESQPVKISAISGSPYIKELKVSVSALQPNGDWKPLEDAEVELMGISKRKTNKEGEVTFKISDEGETVRVVFSLVPEVDIKAISVPKAYIAQPNASGKIYIFAGKKGGFDVELEKEEAFMTFRIETKVGAFMLAGRRFKVSIVSGGGSLEGNIAEPEPGFPFAPPSITYHPPQSLPDNERVREVKLEIEDSEIDLYKTTVTLKVFKDAFLEVRKLGFKDIEPVPIDLVEVNGVKVVPGIVSGVVQENPDPFAGRPINGVTVTAHVADKVKSTETGGEIGPNAGRFTLRELAENNKELQLQRPIVLPFLDFVEEFAHSFDGLRQLGYTTPRFREQDGFLDPVNDQPIFRYRWDLRYETDERKLQRILDAIKRADAALRLTAEVDPMLEKYYTEVIKAIADIVMTAFFEFKVYNKLAEMMSVGKGFAKGIEFSKDASNAIKSRMKKIFDEKGWYYDPKLLDQYVDEFLPEAIQGQKGLTDEAIDAVVKKVKDASGDDFAKAVKEALTSYRKDVSDSTYMLVSGLSADIGRFIKGALKKFGTRFGIEDTKFGEKPFTAEWWFDKLVRSIINESLEMLSKAPEALFGLGDKIAGKIASESMRLFHRPNFQKTVDEGFRQLGRLEFTGNTEEALKQIEKLLEDIENSRKTYETWRAPFSTIASKLTNSVKQHSETLSAYHDEEARVFLQGVFEDTTKLIGSTLDGILPISSGITTVWGLIHIFTLDDKVEKAWKIATTGRSRATGRLAEEVTSSLIDPVFAHATATVTKQFAPVRSRSRQLDEYTAVVNQVKSAIQSGNYERVMQLARNLSEATDAVSDAIEAKFAIVLNVVPVAYEKDKDFPDRTRQLTETVDKSSFYRREFLLWIGSYLIGESDDAGTKALEAADRALTETQNAMGLLDGAIQHAQSLGVTLPHLLRFTHQVQQVSQTEWRITFTVQNIGGQNSPATNVLFVATSGITLSPNSWSLPPLSPNATQTITVTARTPQRFTSGLGIVRTTLGTETEDFNANFVPTIVLLTSNDEIPPVISDPTPKEDEVIRTATPTIAVTVSDFLSGLNISSLRMTLDGQQVNATYNIATRRFSYQSTQTLSEGTHTVVVEATDLDGNTARKEWQFTIRLGAPVEITDLRVSPNPFSPNGDGIDDVLNIHFRLSGDAVLTITVVDSQNKIVKTLANEQPFNQGEHDLTWDGKKDDGEMAPTGTYGVRIAIIREGRQTNVVEATVTADQEPLSISGVSVTPERMRLTKETLTVAFNLSQDAKVTVKVYLGENTEDDGYAVRTITIDGKKGSNAVSWDGKDDNGRFVKPGLYAVAIEADNITLASRVSLAGKVTVLSLPDLLAAGIGSADQDGRTVLTALVRNIGAEPAKNIVVRFAVRDIAVGDVTIPALDVGAETSVELTLDPTRQQLISEDISATVDPDNQIEELEEFNNTVKTRTEIRAVRLAHILPAGVSLVAVPIQLFEPSPQSVFGFATPEETKVAWWDPQKAGEIKYRYANEIPTIEPGKGYFVKLPSERTLQWTGLPARVSGDGRYVLNLQRGWNLIGLPRPGSVPLNEIQVKRPNETSVVQMVNPDNRLVEPYAWTYSNAERRYQLVHPEVGEFGTLDVFKGYWVYAHEPCQLLVPAQSRSILVTRKRSQIDGWFFRIEAEAGEFRDVVVIGKSANRMWAQKPPASPEGQTVRLSLVDEQGRAWGAVVTDGDRRMRWRLVLEADKGVEKVALKFPDLGYLPKGLSAYLVDETTGQRRYLRTTPAFTVTLTPNRSATEKRTFQLVIVHEEPGLLRVVGLKAESLRGRGIAIQFTLTRPAQTQVEVLTMTGRKVATVESGQSRSAGRHQIIWQGRDKSEVQLPMGIYLVRMTATDDEGRQVQATTTVRLR